MDEKYNLQYPKLKINNRMYRNVSFSNTSLKISNNFLGIRLHAYIVKWQNSVAQVNLFSYPIEILLHWFKSRLLKLRKIWS